MSIMVMMEKLMLLTTGGVMCRDKVQIIVVMVVKIIIVGRGERLQLPWLLLLMMVVHMVVLIMMLDLMIG